MITRLFLPRTEASARNIGRAQAAGALRSDISPQVATDLLVGPLFYRMFVQHQPMTEAFVNQVLHYALAGLNPDGAKAAKTRRRG